jgi:hypothetical protein
MVALRFFATESFQAVLGDVHNVSRQCVSYVLKDVIECIVGIANTHIYMPTSEGELGNIKGGFYEIARFPNTVAAIDGTHIRIKTPSTDERLFVDRKKFHSINVQAVCDSRLKFLNIVAKWPGGTHDSFIWNESSLRDLFENGTISDGWLLGDSAYPLRPWLLTPVLNPPSAAEDRYNSAHIRTRNTFGVLKSRFRCVDSSGGALLYTPKKTCKITVAVAVLHNMCVDNRVPLPEGCNPVDHGQIGGEQYVGNPMNDGARVRMRLINGRFSH